MTKIIFMGTPAFAATVLEGILAHGGYQVLAVVTQPDRAVGRKRQMQMTPVKEVALAHDLPIFQPEKLSGSQEMAVMWKSEQSWPVSTKNTRWLSIPLPVTMVMWKQPAPSQ